MIATSTKPDATAQLDATLSTALSFLADLIADARDDRDVESMKAREATYDEVNALLVRVQRLSDEARQAIQFARDCG